MKKNVSVSLLITYLAILVSQVESAPEEFIKEITMDNTNGQWKCAGIKCSKFTTGCKIEVERRPEQYASHMVFLKAFCVGGKGTREDVFKLQRDRNIQIVIESSMNSEPIYAKFTHKGFEGVRCKIEPKFLPDLTKFITIFYNANNEYVRKTLMKFGSIGNLINV